MDTKSGPLHAPELADVVAAADPDALADWLHHRALPADRSHALARLPRAALRALAGFAATDDTVELLDSVDDELAARLLRAAVPADSVRLVDALDSDRGADLLRELDEDTRDRILTGLPAERAAALRALLSWPVDSAAAHMVPETLTVSPGATAAEAIDTVRTRASDLRTDARTGAYIFIVESDGRLAGVVGFRDLVLAAPATPVATLMDTQVRTVAALDDAEDAARALRPLVGPGTAVVSFQNGVGKDEVLTRELGAAAVMGGVCYIAAVIGEPGEIVHTGTMQKLVFGEFDGRSSPRAEALLAACRRAGIDAQISDDIRRLTWEKFVFLVGLSGTTTAIRQPIGPIRSNPDTRAFLRDVMAETVAVGRAQGIALPAHFAEDRLRFCDGLPETMTSSMHGDLKRGKPLELAWLSGAVAAMGARLGVPTPANRAIRDLLALYAQGGPAAT